MATLLKYIKTDLQKFGRDVSGYPKYPVTNLTTMPSVGIKSITHKGVVKGEDGNYIVFVQFFDVKFSKKKMEDWHPIKVEGKLWYYKTPTVRFNPVKMKCQCFTGDTLVPLADGKSAPIKDLVRKDEFFVYSYDIKNKKIVIGKGNNCELKEKNAKLLKVTFDNGKFVKATLDHEFLLKSGEYRRADELKDGDSIENYLKIMRRDLKELDMSKYIRVIIGILHIY